MAIDIVETFQVQAPIDEVWRFMLDPHQVVTCMPGAQLDEVVEERTFHGTIKVRVGAITTSYKGRVQLTDVDDASHTVHMSAEGREQGGGTAKGTLRSQLTTLPDGKTEVVAEASVELTGRIMQMGRGMIQGVSHQLFQQFVNSTRERLETAPGERPAPGAELPAKPIRIVPIVLRTLWQGLLRFLRRLFGRSGD
jgi:carbon monoxide dehydrogenase subunit G